jgi:hypothetical protein
MLKKIKSLSVTLLTVTAFAAVEAQVSSDALLLSEHAHFTTARSLGVGGAMGALGGDMSSMFNNPAGLGIYRSSEFQISPGLQFLGIRSTFVSDTLLPLSVNNRTGIYFGGIGFVYSEELTGDWKNVNFGLSYSRLASFNRSFSFSGVSTGSRLVNFTEEANNSNAIPENLDPFEENLAWNAYMIDNPGGGTSYIGAATDSNYIKKSQLFRQSGGINELGISLAGNYKNKLYIGGTFGIDFMKQRELKDYEETELSGNMDFKSLRFREDRNVSGIGVNFKFGLIYRISKQLRMGLAIHSPTAYGLNETYDTQLSGAVIWNDTLRTTTAENPQVSPTGKFEHNFYSPWLFNFNLGIVLGDKDAKTKGFLGIEGEYLDYSSAAFSLKASDVGATVADQDYINNVNSAISETYQGVARAKIGAELAMDKIRLRAGYRLQTNPYQKSVKGVNDFRNDISLGFGIRNDDFFIDLAYNYTISGFEYSPYYATSATNNPRSVNDLNGGVFLLSFGVRF